MTVTINGTTGIDTPDININATGGADVSGVVSINGGQSVVMQTASTAGVYLGWSAEI